MKVPALVESPAGWLLTFIFRPLFIPLVLVICVIGKLTVGPMVVDSYEDSGFMTWVAGLPFRIIGSVILFPLTLLIGELTYGD